MCKRHIAPHVLHYLCSKLTPMSSIGAHQVRHLVHQQQLAHLFLALRNTPLIDICQPQQTARHRHTGHHWMINTFVVGNHHQPLTSLFEPSKRVGISASNASCTAYVLKGLLLATPTRTNLSLRPHTISPSHGMRGGARVGWMQVQIGWQTRCRHTWSVTCGSF